MAKLFFNQKLFHFFCQNVPRSIIRKNVYYNGILYTLYGRDCREEEKKTKHGEMRWTPKQ